MVTTKNLNFFIVMLRAPSMCGHKGTKIYICKEVFGFFYLASFAYVWFCAWCVDSV